MYCAERQFKIAETLKVLHLNISKWAHYIYLWLYSLQSYAEKWNYFQFLIYFCAPVFSSANQNSALNLCNTCGEMQLEMCTTTYSVSLIICLHKLGDCKFGDWKVNRVLVLMLLCCAPDEDLCELNKSLFVFCMMIWVSNRTPASVQLLQGSCLGFGNKTIQKYTLRYIYINGTQALCSLIDLYIYTSMALKELKAVKLLHLEYQ